MTVIIWIPQCKKNGPCSVAFSWALLGGHSRLIFTERATCLLFHLQLFPLESLDVCFSCSIHLPLKTWVNICSAVLKQRKAYHPVTLSRTGKFPPKIQKKKRHYPLISIKSLAMNLCQPACCFTLVSLVCCVLVWCLFV